MLYRKAKFYTMRRSVYLLVFTSETAGRGRYGLDGGGGEEVNEIRGGKGWGGGLSHFSPMVHRHIECKTGRVGAVWRGYLTYTLVPFYWYV